MTRETRAGGPEEKYPVGLASWPGYTAYSVCNDVITCDVVHRGARYHPVAVCVRLRGLHSSRSGQTSPSGMYMYMFIYSMIVHVHAHAHVHVHVHDGTYRVVLRIVKAG